MSTIEQIIERDQLAHIEDTPLFWVFRNGCQIQRTWNELTAQEQEWQREAAERAAYTAMFAPCGGEQW